MLTFKELTKLIKSEEIDTILIAFTDLYGRFLGKRLDAEFFLENVKEDGVGACNYLLTVDMEMEPTPGYDFASWEKGYGDFHLVPDMNTLRIASWLEKTAMVIADVIDTNSHQLIEIAPRSILKKQIEKANNLGFEAMTASELEYYIFQDSYQDAATQHYKNLKPHNWYTAD